MNIKKTFTGTIKELPDGSEQVRYCKFEPSDIGKFIVLKFRYEEHMFCGSVFGTRLLVNGHEPDMLYAVYEIGWHNDLQKHENNVDYKIKLIPVGNWEAWCPNRSWYTSDIESIVNSTYDLFEENPIFDNIDDATKFALDKNFEMYPKENE